MPRHQGPAHGVTYAEAWSLAQTFVPFLYTLIEEGSPTEDQARRAGARLRELADATVPTSLATKERLRRGAATCYNLFCFLDERPGDMYLASAAHTAEGPTLGSSYGLWHIRLRIFRNDFHGLFEGMRTEERYTL